MRRAAACTLLTIWLSSTAIAGQVYGTIFQNNRPLQAGFKITLTCAGQQGSGFTDSEGVYRLFVRATGSCTLVLQQQGRSAQGSLYSYDRPTEYDFDLVDQGGERLELVPHKSKK